MARRLSIEEIPSWVLGDAPPLAAVLGGAAAPSAAARTRPLPYSNASTRTDSHWRHPSFEHALHGLLADIRDRSAPVIVLTGEAGTGKTLLVQCALGKLGPDAIPVLHNHPHSSFQGFLGSACRQLRLADAQAQGGAAPEDGFDLFWNYLRAQSAQGRHLVVFVDNAHDMAEALLEELALLSKWTESDKHALQVVLIGLPRLHGVVQKLVQRQIVADGYPAYDIAPFEPDEISAFVCAKLSEGAADAAQVIAPAAIDRIASYSQGIPRLILTLCSLAQLNARLEGGGTITPEIVDQVARSAMVSENKQHADNIKADEAVRPDDPAPAQPAPDARSTNGQEECQMTRLDDLTKILKSLQNRSPGIEASALISEDGLMIASALSADLDDTRVGGMTATLLSLGTRASAELRRGEVREVIVRGDNGYAVMVNAGSGTLLLVLTTEDTKLGLIFFDMREAIKGISKVLFR